MQLSTQRKENTNIVEIPHSKKFFFFLTISAFKHQVNLAYGNTTETYVKKEIVIIKNFRI